MKENTDVSIYPHRIRLARGHLTHLACAARAGLLIVQYRTACGHTYSREHVADMAAEGRLCHGCDVATREGQ